jgi:CheY-like chemotaxis protein
MTDKTRIETLLLLAGQLQPAEFSHICDALGSARMATAATLSEAQRLLAEGLEPEVIAIAQSWPGQWSAGEVDHLRRLAPLARVVGLLGSWCEGEARSGTPWPAAQRIYWHQWLPRMRLELARQQAGRCPVWGLPVTATEEDRVLAAAGELADTLDSASRATLPCQAVIGIAAADFEMAEFLAAACRRHGYSTISMRLGAPWRTEGLAATIWDCAAGDPAEFEALVRLSSSVRPAPVVALLSFPRPEDCQQALLAGASAVVSKPLHVSELLFELRRLIQDRRSTPAAMCTA